MLSSSSCNIRKFLQNATFSLDGSLGHKSLIIAYNQNVSPTAATSVLTTVTASSIEANVLSNSLSHFDFNKAAFFQNVWGDTLQEGAEMLEKALVQQYGVGEFKAKLSRLCVYYGSMFLSSTLDNAAAAENQQQASIFSAMYHAAIQTGSVLIVELLIEKVQKLLEDTGKNIAVANQSRWKKLMGKAVEKTGTYFPNLYSFVANIRESSAVTSLGVAGVATAIKIFKGP